MFRNTTIHGKLGKNNSSAAAALPIISYGTVVILRGAWVGYGLTDFCLAPSFFLNFPFKFV